MTTSHTTVVPVGRSGRVFRDRREAGRALGRLLESHRGRNDVIVLGLARGGVPVAWEVAAALDVPMDVFVVRKLGLPGHEEFAMGAIAGGGVAVLNDDVVRDLHVTPEQVREVVDRESRELGRREATYRDGRAPADVAGKTVIVVDDGLATGSSMTAAVDALRASEPAAIVVAVPAAPASTCRELEATVDDVVCATMPFPFRAVGEAFWDFRQVTDEEVQTLVRTPTVGRSTTATPPVLAADIIAAAARPAPAGVPSREDIRAIVGDARVVLIGESSHGTEDFYRARADITRGLVEDLGFGAIAAEADWPDAHRVNRYVAHRGGDTSAEESLRGFTRFPAWMWRNTVMEEVVAWLHHHNEAVIGRGEHPVGFFGLDLYSLTGR